VSPAEIPWSVLFGNPDHLKPTLSPDGTRLFYLAPVDGVLNVWMAPLDRLAQARPVTRYRGHGVTTFTPCQDGRTLCYRLDSGGDEGWRLYLLDLETGAERCVTPAGAQARLLAHRPASPEQMLVGLNLDRPALHDVYRLHLRSGELTKVAVNPGYLSWVIDEDLRIRGGTAGTPDGGLAIHLGEPGAPPGAPWLEVDYADRAGTSVVGFSADGATIYLTSPAGANASRLLAVDIATRRQRVLAADPEYDVYRVVLDPGRNVPLSAVVAKDRDEWVFLDPGFEADVKQIRGELTASGLDGELILESRDRSGQRWIVTLVQPDGPARYYCYHQPEGRLEFLFSHLAALDQYQLSAMEPFRFQARDGVTVHGYVTWPPGATRRGLPAVLNVHGGPWSRHRFDLSEEAQWLASRGYACVQVNFRGSTGYGKRFQNLGARQWGAAMQADLLDAVAHLTADGAIDPARVAIMGCSYGGYAALAGAAFTPDAFRCAVDLCGPANLLTLLADGAAHRTPFRSFLYANIGNPETERDMLWARSPLSRAGDIRIPVLVAQGANDTRVPLTEAEQIVAALAEHGLPHEYLLFPDEGHGLMRPANRERYYATVERFLAEHLKP
jgi:dipeptidyl aminopeptidase/acylaminoacyl peptidase